MRTAWLAILALAIAVSAYAETDPAETDQMETAQEFVERFVGRSIGDLVERYTPEMKMALPPAKSVDIVDGLVIQHGPVQRVEEGWFEDRVQGYRRYRVPVVFEKETLDVRVIFDGDDRIAGIFIAPHGQRPVQGDAPGVEREVTVGELELNGTLTLPEGYGPFPAVVLVHGSGPNDRDGTVGPNKPLRDIAWGLVERGIAALRYEKRSYEYPENLSALGESLTVREEAIDDAVAAIQLLGRSYGIDPGRIYVAGHSLGGHLAPRIAAEVPDVAGVIILAGSTLPLPEKIVEQQQYIFMLDGELSATEQNSMENTAAQAARIRAAINGEEEVSGFVLGAPIGYYKDLEAYDPPAIMAGLDMPCLVIQGGRDYQVTMDDYALWKVALADKPDACLRVFDRLDHLLREGEGKPTPSDYDVAIPVSPAVLDCIANWILTGTCCAQ